MHYCEDVRVHSYIYSVNTQAIQYTVLPEML
jgi:hypothetical protein